VVQVHGFIENALLASNGRAPGTRTIIGACATTRSHGGGAGGDASRRRCTCSGRTLTIQLAVDVEGLGRADGAGTRRSGCTWPVARDVALERLERALLLEELDPSSVLLRTGEVEHTSPSSSWVISAFVIEKQRSNSFASRQTIGRSQVCCGKCRTILWATCVVMVPAS
jgi:hypothetical protein